MWIALSHSPWSWGSCGSLKLLCSANVIVDEDEQAEIKSRQGRDAIRVSVIQEIDC